MFSQTYVAAIINILVMILPRLGVEVGSEQLTTTIQTIVTVVTGLWILVRRYKVGDISPLGVRKN